MSTGLTTPESLLPKQQDEMPMAPTFGGKNTWFPGLTWICVLFVLIGITGGISTMFEAKNLFVGPVLASKSMKPRNAHERRLKIQTQKMEKAIAASQKKYFPVLAYMVFFKLTMSIAFLFAVGFLVTNSPKGRKFALYTCGFAIFYHVCLVVVTMLIMAPVGGPLQEMMRTMINDAGRQAGAGIAEREEAIAAAQSGVAFGLSIAFLIVLAIKGTFYGIIMAYLGRPEIKNLFGEALVETPIIPTAEAIPPQSGPSVTL